MHFSTTCLRSCKKGMKLRECQIRMTSAILFDGIIFIIICAQFGSKPDPVQQKRKFCFSFRVWILIRSANLCNSFLLSVPIFGARLKFYSQCFQFYVKIETYLLGACATLVSESELES